MEIKGVIFDLDGVLVDTAEHHYLAWKRLADELGIPCPPERKDQVRGVSRRRSLEIVLAGYQVSAEEAESLMTRKDSYYQELIQDIGPQDILPGAHELLNNLKNNGIKMAVATVSKNAHEVLSRLKILEEFDALVDGHSGARSKPAPDLFLYAAAKLGLPPSECLVIEDAPAGIEAAEAAGMWKIALGPAERFSTVRPDIIIPSLQGMSYRRIIQLLEEAQAEAAPWLVREQGFSLDSQRQFETLFTVGNGYLGTRGSFEERYLGDLPATLLNGLYDDAPIFHTELANVPNWSSFELSVAGERFSLVQGKILHHERALDLRDGTLRRRVRWQSPKGHTVEILTLRLASMSDPHITVQLYAVTALDFAGEIELQSWLEGKPEGPGIPPLPEIGLLHWKTISQGFTDHQTAYLHIRTRRSRIDLGMAMRLLLEGVPEGEFRSLESPSSGLGLGLRCHLNPGDTAVAIKLVAIHSSWDSEDPVGASLRKLQDAQAEDYARILREHRSAWSRLWRESDVLIEGDEEAQRAVRFNIYHLLIAAPRVERTSIPAKALSGFGYRGHIFWDTELFMLPFFTFTQPEIARRLLMYRYHTLPGARENARKRGYHGAMFAWESATDGSEVTPRWFPNREGQPIPIRCGELEHHITADVAYAVWQYWQASGDDEFMRDYGAEILLSTAQFWASRVEYDAQDGRYHIRHVIGPDEYHEDVNDNAFTNKMASWNLLAGVQIWQWLRKNFPDQARKLALNLDLSDAEPQRWQDIAEKLDLLYDHKSGLIEQFKGFFALKDINNPTKLQTPRSRTLLEQVKKSQIIKQPDVLMLLYLLRDEFTERTLKVNWEYYNPRTDHRYGSSLSPSIHAILACWIGDLRCAYEHFRNAALIDLQDIRGNTEDGIHAASAGGVWQAVVLGFGGLQLTRDGPRVYPCLPPRWKRLRFAIRYRGRRFLFDLKPRD